MRCSLVHVNDGSDNLHLWIAFFKSLAVFFQKFCVGVVAIFSVAYLNDQFMKWLFLFRFLNVRKIVADFSIGSFLPVVVLLQSVIEELMIDMLQCVLAWLYQDYVSVCPGRVNVRCFEFSVVVIKTSSSFAYTYAWNGLTLLLSPAGRNGFLMRSVKSPIALLFGKK